MPTKPRVVHPFPFDEPALWRHVVYCPPARACPFAYHALFRCRHDASAVWWLRCR